MATTTTETETPTHHLSVDGGRTYLPICTCSWRGQPTPDRVGAWHQAVIHERVAHPGQINARGKGQATKAWEAAKARARA